MAAKTPGSLPMVIVLILMCVCVCAVASAKRTGAVLAFAAALVVFHFAMEPGATGVFLPLPRPPVEQAPLDGPAHPPAPPPERRIPCPPAPTAATTTSAEHTSTRAAFATSTVLACKPPRPVRDGDPDPSLTRSAPHHGAGSIDVSAFRTQATTGAHAMQRREFASAQTPISLDNIRKLRSIQHQQGMKSMKVATQPQRHFSL